jgi:hypothetical protein
MMYDEPIDKMKVVNDLKRRYDTNVAKEKDKLREVERVHYQLGKNNVIATLLMEVERDDFEYHDAHGKPVSGAMSLVKFRRKLDAILTEYSVSHLSDGLLAFMRGRERTAEAIRVDLDNNRYERVDLDNNRYEISTTTGMSW